MSREKRKQPKREKHIPPQASFPQHAESRGKRIQAKHPAQNHSKSETQATHKREEKGIGKPQAKKNANPESSTQQQNRNPVNHRGGVIRRHVKK